jgi:hypothetical protein
MALLGSSTVTMTGNGPPEQLSGMTVSEDFFPMVGWTVPPTV